MVEHPITELPQDEAVLRARAKKVRHIDQSIRTLIQDMTDSMYAANGVGIAAPQIGVSLRVIVIALPDEEPFAMLNPEIVKTSGERRVSEGCLSIPGYRGEITRAVKVVAKGMDVDGKQMRVRAEDDLKAQALQHEIDHVNGVLYIDHLDSPDDLQRLEDLEEAEEWDEAGEVEEWEDSEELTPAAEVEGAADHDGDDARAASAG